jgi:hypothetical protein
VSGIACWLCAKQVPASMHPEKKSPRSIEKAAPGTIILLPLADGRFGAVRYIRTTPDGFLIGAIIVATTWIGGAPPSADDPKLKEVLMLTYGGNSGPWCQTVDWRLPKNARALFSIGSIREDEKLADQYGSSVSLWDVTARMILKQWLWDHDRAAYDARERAEEEERETAARELRRKQVAKLSRMTLDDLATAKFPAYFLTGCPRSGRKGVFDALRGLVDDLRRDPSISPAAARKHVAKRTKELNVIADRDGFIGTLEREMIFTEFEKIFTVAKMPDLLKVVDEHRDW